MLEPTTSTSIWIPGRDNVLEQILDGKPGYLPDERAVKYEFKKIAGFELDLDGKATLSRLAWLTRCRTLLKKTPADPHAIRDA